MRNCIRHRYWAVRAMIVVEKLKEVMCRVTLTALFDEVRGPCARPRNINRLMRCLGMYHVHSQQSLQGER